MVSWNVGGSCLSAFPEGTRQATAEFGGSDDTSSQQWLSSVVVGLQEVPRIEAGWKSVELEGWTILQHRAEDAWRGVAVAYRPQCWTVMRRKQCSRGIWVKLRHVLLGVEAWFGSCHFTQGCSQLQHSTEVREALQALPPNMLPAVLAADTNANLGWTVGGDQPHGVAYGMDGKGVRMLEAFGHRGLSVIGVKEGHERLPTSRPRKQGVRGNVIDMIAGARIRTGPLWIAKDSHCVVGTDHEAVMCYLYLQCATGQAKRFDCRPRQVVRELPVSEHIDQNVLQSLAHAHTRCKASQGYKDSDQVKTLFSEARRNNTAAAWKRAHEARRNERHRWEQTRLDAASVGDWKELGKARRVQQNWEDHFADVNLGMSHEKVHEHLQAIYEGEPLDPWDERGETSSDPFSMEDFLSAARKGRLGRATGPDGVPHELPLSLAGHSTEGPKLLAWFNDILATGNIPTEWGSVVMILLAKIPKPETAKHVRPISLGSGTSKLFSRMLLEKSLESLGEPSSRQCAGKGRQATEYVFCVARMMSLEREWKAGFRWVKLDLQKAFDRVSRGKLMRTLVSRLGKTWITRAWHRLLGPTQAILQTKWSQSRICMKSSIRQGAVESPAFFALVMDICVEEASQRFGWSPECPGFEGCNLREILFMDAAIMWDVDGAALGLRLEQLAMVLSEWGLLLNADKCQLYRSPHCQSQDQVVVGGHTMIADEHLTVMGIHFRVNQTASDILAPLLGRARDAFWGMKHILCRRSSLKQRIRVLDICVGNCLLWCSGGLQSDVQALGMVNSFQFQLIVWMLRRRRHRDETWLAGLSHQGFQGSAMRIACQRGQQMEHSMVASHLAVQWPPRQVCKPAGTRSWGAGRLLSGFAVVGATTTEPSRDTPPG